ncbi:hypothetical protein [Nocardia sp. NPDC050175]|uniref:hypothetical protein n=1 Tax=Nocardia sp. NPDC050175 TaxID=3364317 RepID=UPI0037A56C20
MSAAATGIRLTRPSRVRQFRYVFLGGQRVLVVVGTARFGGLPHGREAVIDHGGFIVGGQSPGLGVDRDLAVELPHTAVDEPQVRQTLLAHNGVHAVRGDQDIAGRAAAVGEIRGAR